MLETLWIISNGVALYWGLSQINWELYVPLNEDGFPIKPFGCKFCLLFWSLILSTIVAYLSPFLAESIYVLSLPITISYLLILNRYE